MTTAQKDVVSELLAAKLIDLDRATAENLRLSGLLYDEQLAHKETARALMLTLRELERAEKWRNRLAWSCFGMVIVAGAELLRLAVLAGWLQWRAL